MLYAAQPNAQVDAEIAEKSRFRMKTILYFISIHTTPA